MLNMSSTQHWHDKVITSTCDVIKLNMWEIIFILQICFVKLIEVESEILRWYKNLL